jgi:hypothetical protein
MIIVIPEGGELWTGPRPSGFPVFGTSSAISLAGLGCLTGWVISFFGFPSVLASAGF